MPHATSERRIGFKSLVGIGGCLLGLMIVYFGYGVGTESPKKEAAARVNPQPEKQKPTRPMNVALDNMVFFAQDLGFTVNTANDATAGKEIAMRIESQLHGLRELYRQEVGKNPQLAGSMTLQFDIGTSGEVRQPRELSSRINDADFKKAVLDEVAQWSFADLVSENLKVTCPLLFVHEGMDITTLVRWEKATSNASDQPALAHVGDEIASKTQVATRSASAPKTVAKRPSAPAPTAQTATMPGGKLFQIKYATALRKDPNFSSPSLATFAVGTRVIVLQKQGDWVEVQANHNGPVGFIRKEFVTLAEARH